MNSDELNIVREQIAPTGSLRVALNMSNFLLINQQSSDGQPDGVSPAVARLIAKELDLELTLISYDGPGLIDDAATSNEWDLANIAAEPERAKVIEFSPAYCEIQASYLLPANSRFKRIDDLDQTGVRIAVKQRAAYDLWLSANLKQAELCRAESHDATFELFCDQQLDALAGLRPKLIEQQALLPGSILLNESFTAVQQSIGCQQGKPAVDAYLQDFVLHMLASGKLASFIEHYGVTGKLSPASISY